MYHRFLTIVTLVIWIAGKGLAEPPNRSLPQRARFNQLAALLHEQRLTRTTSSIVLLGFHPIGHDENTQTKVADLASFRPPSRSHGDAVSWIQQTLPNAPILCIPLEDKPSVKAFRVAIGKALQAEATAMYIPRQILQEIATNRQDLTEAIAECWSDGCLPFTVLNSEDAHLPSLGVLTVGLRPAKSEAHLPNLLIPEDVFEESRLLGDVNANVAAYLAVIAAATPAVEFPRHLDLAAKLALTGPLSDDHRYHELDASQAIAPDQCMVQLGKSEFAWNESVGKVDSREMFTDLKPGGKSDSVGLRISLGVRPDTKIRWLAVAGLLLDSKAVLFVPTEVQGALVLEAKNEECAKVASQILKSHVRNEAGNFYLFNAISRDVEPRRGKNDD